MQNLLFLFRFSALPFPCCFLPALILLTLKLYETDATNTFGMLGPPKTSQALHSQLYVKHHQPSQSAFQKQST